MVLTRAAVDAENWYKQCTGTNRAHVASVLLVCLCKAEYDPAWCFNYATLVVSVTDWAEMLQEMLTGVQQPKRGSRTDLVTCLHLNGLDLLRNSRPAGSESLAAACLLFVCASLLRPFAANPPGLVAPRAYFSCSVTQVEWFCSRSRLCGAACD
jgi:hypothetical protein